MYCHNLKEQDLHRIEPVNERTFIFISKLLFIFVDIGNEIAFKCYLAKYQKLVKKLIINVAGCQLQSPKGSQQPPTTRKETRGMGGSSNNKDPQCMVAH